jgi:serine/threonine-protein kinase HipA
MKSSLSAWWDGRKVGQLTMDEHGDMGFAYDSGWLADAKARPISRSLPLRAEAFDRRETRPFFAGLLPEETVRAEVARVLGLSKGNDFGLLKALGGDVAGALTLWPEDELPPPYDGKTVTEPLGDNALVELIDTLSERPLLAGREGLRLSLAGAQTKVPVVLVDDKVALPAPGQPTTHILKPEIGRFPATVENEAFVMQLAAACELEVAAAVPRLAKGRPYLLVTRYDRSLATDGQMRRLHQEDFCQALAITPERKYAAEGGPTFKTSFALLREVASRPAIDVLKLLDAAVFNLIVGNADAHGKNFSLLYPEDGTTHLAPLYDLMCSAAYPDVKLRPAMKIAETSDLKDFKLRVWEKFANDISVGLPYMRRRAKELVYLAEQRAEAVAKTITAQGFDSAVLSRYTEIVVGRAKRVGASL